MKLVVLNSLNERGLQKHPWLKIYRLKTYRIKLNAEALESERGALKQLVKYS